MIGIYFSGTGNTRYCMEQFVSNYDDTMEIIPLEEIQPQLNKLQSESDIVFAYPIYYSSLPKIVREFIDDYKNIWQDKNVFIIATMGLFSGDGAGLAARQLKKYGVHIMGGVHIQMPDCICDVKALKRNFSKNQQIVVNAQEKIKYAVQSLRIGTPICDGLKFYNHLAGLFGQRLWFFNKTRKYSNNLKINAADCIGCGKCVKICPMKNLSISHGKSEPGGRCTMCYRCINQCPKRAITLKGNNVIAQYKVDDFVSEDGLKIKENF